MVQARFQQEGDFFVGLAPQELAVKDALDFVYH